MVVHGVVSPRTADLPRLHRRRGVATSRRCYSRRIIFDFNTKWPRSVIRFICLRTVPNGAELDRHWIFE
jgi:hypothetical protein